MKIAICDDEKAQRDYIENFVKQWGKERNRKLTIEVFENSEQFMFHWSEDKNIDVVLLDIQMGKQSGMELARKIRETDHFIQIVFVTGLTEYVCEGYEVEALHYLIKPINKEVLYRCLDKARERDELYGEKMMIESKQGKVSLYVKDIWYIEAIAHSCMIYTKDKAYEVRQSISQFEHMEELKNTTFVKCHRSFLVNLKHVYHVGKNSIELDDRRVIPVSRNSYKQTIEAFVHNYRRS